MLPQRERVGKEGAAFGLPPLVARSTARRWDPCARCREVVSPPASLQLPWAAKTCVRMGLGGTRRAIALGAGVCRSVCPAASSRAVVCLSGSQQQGGAGM